ncbi:MAG: WYL domain-containing protein [Roseburia sp.]
MFVSDTCFEPEKVGKLFCTVEVTDMNWFLSYVLSYGSHIRVLEPLEVKEKVMQEIDKMKKMY